MVSNVERAAGPWLPPRWDAEADVVVVGFGAAGAATAITAQSLGAQVILLEKAPRGQEGGNTRVAGQGYLNVSDAKLAADYQRRRDVLLDVLERRHFTVYKPFGAYYIMTDISVFGFDEIGRAHV